MLLFWYFRTCPRKPLIGSLWGRAGRQAQITGIVILVFDLGRSFPTLPACAAAVSIPWRCLLGSWANGLSPRCSLESESWWLCTILANCHGAGGRGVLAPQGQSRCHRAHCVQVQSWSVWRRQWSAVGRDLCHLIAPSCSVIVVCVKR